MTFPLRRKRRTTPSSTLRSRAFEGLIATAGLSLVLSSAGFATLDAAEPAQSSGLKSVFSKPIQMLRGRNAEDRLHQYRDDQRQSEAAATRQRPAVPAAKAAQVEIPFLDLDAAAELDRPQFQAPIPVPGGPSFQLLSDQGNSDGVPSVQQAPLTSTADLVESSYQNTASDPSQLKRVTTILPFADYEPETSKIDQQFDSDLIAPSEVPLGEQSQHRRSMDPILYQWHASNLYHYPLYFEDPQLERYGHTLDENYLQPLASVGRFGIQLVGLPYQMTIDPVWKRSYALGWHRPGDVAPKQIHQIPWNTKAAINQAAVVTGLSFIFP